MSQPYRGIPANQPVQPAQASSTQAQVVPYTSTGKYSLNQLAQTHGMSAHQLVQGSLAGQANPALTSYVGAGNYNLPVPSGVQLMVPSTNWRQ